MNLDIKNRWIEALRSEKYKQNRSSLKEGNKFCCLGVLCDLYLKEKGLSWDYIEKLDGETMGFAYLPLTVQEWAQLKEADVDLDSPYKRSFPSATKLNDRGISFKEIADYIEQTNI